MFVSCDVEADKVHDKGADKVLKTGGLGGNDRNMADIKMRILAEKWNRS